MAFTGLVDAWNSSRRERTHMNYGERVHSVEKALRGRMPTRDRARRERRDHGRAMRHEWRGHRAEGRLR